jgi:uncharacterized protein
MRPRLALLLLTISCIPLFAHADDASKMAKIHEFFKVAKIDQLSDQTMRRVADQMKSGMMQQMLGVKLNADQQQKANELSDKTMKILSSSLSWDTLEPEYAKIYAAAYTEQQLDDLLAFYKSPTGQVLVAKTPILMQQANAIVQQRVISAVPQIQQMLKDYMAEATTKAQPDKPKE